MRLPELHRRLLSEALDSGHAYRLVFPGGYTVDMAGGQLRVAVLTDGSMDLTGPAADVASGTVRL